MSTENSEIAVTEEASKQSIPNRLPLLPKLDFQLSPPSSVFSWKNNLGVQRPKPNMVRFPNTKVEVPPLHTEPDHEDPCVSAKTSNPLILFQVYALAGLLISKWIWARWNERKGLVKSPNDERTEGKHSDDANHRSLGNE